MDLDLEKLAESPYRDQAGSDRQRQRSVSHPIEKISDDGKHSRDERHDDRRRDRDDRDRRDSRSRHERHRDYDRRDRDYRRDDRRRDYDDRRRDDRRRSRSPRRAQSPQIDTEPITEDERDKRTVFVQQLAARLRTKELRRFFEQAGPVRDAQIVKDKVSGRSKGVGYVEFKLQESLPAALAMTGTKLLGIPVIIQLTEAEKNRQAREEALAQGKVPGHVFRDAPFHRLYVGNIHFNVGEDDVRTVFEPFGDIEFVSLQKDPETGRSKGYGFVQFKEPAHAREALDKMNGFDLAGRSIRVGLGNDNFTPEGQPLEGKFSSKDFDRDQVGPSSSSNRQQSPRERRDISPSRRRKVRELDDSEQGGMSFQHISRSDLMRKLARSEDNLTPAAPPSPPRKQFMQPEYSRGVLLKNMFNPAEETEPHWQRELAADVTAECTEKYGEVVHCHVDSNSIGEIYVKFKTLEGGKAAIQGLNGRWFGGRTIGAVALVEGVYNTKFPEVRNL